MDVGFVSSPPLRQGKCVTTGGLSKSQPPLFSFHAHSTIKAMGGSLTDGTVEF